MPYVLLVVGMLLTSTGPVLIKPLGPTMGPSEIALGRVLAALPVLFVLLSTGAWLKGERLTLRSLPIERHRWQLFGACSYAVNNVLFIMAVLFTATANAYAIAGATPVYMIGYQLSIGKRPRAFELLAAAVVLTGLMLFFVRGFTADGPWGVACALGAGITFAGYIFAQKQLGEAQSTSGARLTDGTVLLGLLLTIPLVIALMATLIPLGQLERLWTPLSFPQTPEAWTLIGLLGVQIALPSWLWARAIPRVSPYVSGAMPTLTAVWAPVWTGIFLNETPPDSVEVLALIVVHGGVLTAAIVTARQRKTAT